MKAFSKKNNILNKNMNIINIIFFIIFIINLFSNNFSGKSQTLLENFIIPAELKFTQKN